MAKVRPGQVTDTPRALQVASSFSTELGVLVTREEKKEQTVAAARMIFDAADEDVRSGEGPRDERALGREPPLTLPR